MVGVASPISVTSPHPIKVYESLKEATFYDRDADIHDPILSTQSMYEAIKLVHESASTSGDHLNLFHSKLAKVAVLETYNYP